MKRPRGRSFHRLVGLLVLGALVYVVYTELWPMQNMRASGAQLDSAINRELSRAGIVDADVLSQLRQVQKRWGFSWIQTDRRIRISNAAQRAQLAQTLSAIARQQGYRVSWEDSGTALTVEIKRFVVLIQRLVFVQDVERQAQALSVAQRPQVAIVIDDVAYDMHRLDEFASLNVPLTFAILPRDRHSADLARKAKDYSFGVMLHLPMEPKDMKDNHPGPAGLFLKMTPDELQKQFERNVESVPGLMGINNHMGSAFTESPEKMKLVLGWVKRHDLFFLDSKTTAKSVVCKVAATVGVPCRSNETFLDNEDDATYIEKQLDVVLRLALKRKQTIAIGHYRRKAILVALANKIPEFKRRGVDFVTIQSLYPHEYSRH